MAQHPRDVLWPFAGAYCRRMSPSEGNGAGILTGRRVVSLPIVFSTQFVFVYREVTALLIFVLSPSTLLTF